MSDVNKGGNIEPGNIAVLTAHNKSQLRQIASLLLKAVIQNNYDNFDLENICYTLQSKYSRMEERVAFIAKDIEQLKSLLSKYPNFDNSDSVIQGSANNSEIAAMNSDEDMREFISTLVQHKKYSRIMSLWANGADIDWNLMYQNIGKNPKNVSLFDFDFDSDTSKEDSSQSTSVTGGIDEFMLQKQYNERIEKIVVLSARSLDRLNDMAKSLVKCIAKYSDKDFANICYTLQVGREQMSCRLAFVASSVSEAVEYLKKYLTLGKDEAGIFVSDENSVDISSISREEELQNFICELISHNKYSQVADLWVKGIDFDWSVLYSESSPEPRLISLPTYAFSKQNFWLRNNLDEDEQKCVTHPYIQHNISNFFEQRFSSSLNSDNFDLNKYSKNNRLSKLVQLEMILKATSLSLAEEYNALSLFDLKFNKPIEISSTDKEIYIDLNEVGNSEIECSIIDAEDQGENFADAYIECIDEDEDEKSINADIVQNCVYSPEHNNKTDFEIRINNPGSDDADEMYIEFNDVHKSNSSLVLNIDLLEQCINTTFETLFGNQKNFAVEQIHKVYVNNTSAEYFCALISADKANKTFNIDICDSEMNAILCFEGIVFSSDESKAIEDKKYELMSFNEVLKPENIFTYGKSNVKNIVAFLSDKKSQDILKDKISKYNPNVNITFVSDSINTDSSNIFNIDYYKKPTYIDCLSALKNKLSKIDVLLYFYNAAENSTNCLTGILYTLQAIAELDLKVDSILVAGEYSNEIEYSYCEALAGLGRSLRLVIPNTKFKTAFAKKSNKLTFENFADLLWKETYVSENKNVYYADGVRKVTAIVEEALPNNPKNVLKNGGVYVITGGLGGLGIIFAKWLAQKYSAKLVLVNRSSPDKNRERFEQIKQYGSDAIYLQADVCDISQMQNVIAKAKESFGKIDGFIHAAGLEGGSSILDKSEKEFKDILSANINGTLVIDEVLKNEDLDFICYFSSNAAILGDFGSGCYAAGKRFQTAYALSKKDGKKRIVINWPLWHSIGMNLKDEQASSLYMKSSGQKLLEEQDGTAVFEKVLSMDFCQHLVFDGIRGNVYRFLNIENLNVSQVLQNKELAVNKKVTPQSAQTDIKQSEIEDLKILIGEILKISPYEIQNNDKFADLGFDNVSLTNLSQIISAYYKININKDIVLTNGSVNKLLEYLMDKYSDRLNKIYNVRSSKAAISVDNKPAKKAVVPVKKSETASIKKPSIKLDIETYVTEKIKNAVGDIIMMPIEKIALNVNFADFGFDSISLTSLSTELADVFKTRITPDVFFSYPTVSKLAKFIADKDNVKQEFAKYSESIIPEENTSDNKDTDIEQPEVKAPKKHRSLSKRKRKGFGNDTSTPTKISIIGMSGRFPDSRNIDELWDILFSGKNVIKDITAQRKEWACLNSEKAYDNINKCVGIVPGISEFEPLFFEISPREAEKIDPRQRLLLQEAWKALEDAGYGSDLLANDRIGMYVGCEEGDYNNLLKGDKVGITTNAISVLPARLAYFLDLKGPNMAVDTACSSGLTALHQACLSIKAGECDAAVVAGVSLLSTPESYRKMADYKMLSPSGKCYAFDKRADGMVPSEAVAVVVLKREDKAIKDGNPIYANIIAGGINYDGKTNGITAPSGERQKQLLTDVYKRYNINPSDISYIVTHGTGTKLGDPMEINALTDAFAGFDVKGANCAITSVKPNIGHSLAASGIVSLISLVKAMQEQLIPASINCEQVNDYIDWNNSPLYINRENKEWNDINGKPRIGAVSSFGMSGTNVHIVVENTSKSERSSPAAEPCFILPLSAKTGESMDKLILNLIEYIESGKIKNNEIKNLSRTLLAGRQHLNIRCAVVAENLDDAVTKLKMLYEQDKKQYTKVSKNFVEDSDISLNIENKLNEAQAHTDNKTLYKKIMSELAELYCEGYSSWCGNMLKDTSLIHIPTYPFVRETYWANSSDTSETAEIKPAADNKDKQTSEVFSVSDLFVSRRNPRKNN